MVWAKGRGDRKGTDESSGLCQGKSLEVRKSDSQAHLLVQGVNDHLVV